MFHQLDPALEFIFCFFKIQFVLQSNPFSLGRDSSYILFCRQIFTFFGKIRGEISFNKPDA